jgi:exodeoxyribonuclease VII large subunit
VIIQPRATPWEYLVATACGLKGRDIRADMAKPLQSQWDFGAPLPAPERKIFSVAELTAKVRTLLETNLGHAWVSGEITNFRLQTSGHAYFTLKDLYAQVQCVLFKSDARALNRAHLRDGQTIVLKGEMTVYEPRGQYQLRVTAVELQGQGKLQAAFEALKQRLNAEGLFAAARKRPLPRCPARLGIVSSLDGAALRDVLHVIERRQPALEIFLAPSRVQGTGAAQEIARAIRTLNDWSAAHPQHPLDLILITRGGGSLEDLWAFNEEEVARAIFNSRLPIVSAVGHEIDFTIGDFVADLRAATPSAAAELITEGACSSRQEIADLNDRAQRLLRVKLQRARQEIDAAKRALERRRPDRVLRDRQQRLDDLQDSMQRCANAALRNAHEDLRHATENLARLRLSERLARERQQLQQSQRNLKQLAQQRLRATRQQLKALDSQLRLLGPHQTLQRGYSITTDAETGAILRDPAKTKPGKKIQSRLAKGTIISTIEET